MGEGVGSTEGTYSHKNQSNRPGGSSTCSGGDSRPVDDTKTKRSAADDKAALRSMVEGVVGSRHRQTDRPKMSGSGLGKRMYIVEVEALAGGVKKGCTEIHNYRA